MLVGHTASIAKIVETYGVSSSFYLPPGGPLLIDVATRTFSSALNPHKIGHHGLHNAITKDFALEVMGSDGSFAMMPFSKVKRWPIPNDKSLDTLRENNADVIRPDKPTVINVSFRPGLKIPESTGNRIHGRR